MLLGGCASTPGNSKDPFEQYNRAMFQFNDIMDRAVVKPVSQGYKTVMPPPAQMMVSNVFSNLNDVVVTLNDLLQLKLTQAVSDASRVVINTTVGMFGIADVATVVGLEKHDEDFGQTLGHWGVGSGPYLVLPLLGPSSVRDTVGFYADIETSPLRKEGHVDIRNDAMVLDFVAHRARLLDSETILDEAATDRYAFIRDAYLQRRQNEVYDGNPPRPKYEDEEDDSKPDPAAKPGPHSSSDATPIPPVAMNGPQAETPAQLPVAGVEAPQAIPAPPQAPGGQLP